MHISVDESQMSIFFLDCFRFCMNGTEYNVVLNKRDLEVYEYGEKSEEISLYDAEVKL